MYFSGEASTKGKKMSGAMMPSALLMKYPRPYDVPLEPHINGMIQDKFGRSQSSRQAAAHGSTAVSTMQAGPPLQ